MRELVDMITAAATAAGVIGPAIAWVVHRTDAKFKKVETRLEACQMGEATYLLVIELLFQIAPKTAAAKAVMARCQAHLDELRHKTRELLGHD